LLCGGAVTAGVLVVHNVADRAKEAVKPITDPTVPGVPTDIPDLPGLPTDLPTLPTDLPNLGNGAGKPVTITYEVTGDGSAEILYAKDLGEAPTRKGSLKLPFKTTVDVVPPTLVLITAARSGSDDKPLSCRILVDGKQVTQSTRNGQFTSVTCSKLIFE
jgi:hypothetical protein